MGVAYGPVGWAFLGLCLVLAIVTIVDTDRELARLRKRLDGTPGAPPDPRDVPAPTYRDPEPVVEDPDDGTQTTTIPVLGRHRAASRRDRRVIRKAKRQLRREQAAAAARWTP